MGDAGIFSESIPNERDQPVSFWLILNNERRLRARFCERGALARWQVNSWEALRVC